MTTLKFADTHNMVVFLSKPKESDGFEQIVDFLNAHPIKYALTVNPTIYTSCIEQFRATIKAKTVNGEVQLQALVDGKKIVITELTNLEIVSGKFLMYPRNMRRAGKGFSGRETPLFQTMVVQDQEEICEGSAMPTDPHHTPTIIQTSTSQPQRKQRPRKPMRKDTKIPQSSGPIDNVADEAINEEMDDSLEKAATTATSLDAEQDREFKNKVMDDFCKEKGIRRKYSIARTPQQNGVAERRNRTLIEASKTMLADFKLPTTFWAEAVNTACYVHNRVLVVKPYNKTPYELFRDFKPALSFMRPFGCHVTILNTLDNLDKFDGKSDEGFFVGYSLSSKAFRVHKENLIQVEDGPDNENDEKDKSKYDISPNEVNIVGQHVNTANPEVDTSRLKLYTADPSVNIASSYDLDSPKDMFKMGASHTLEATHVEFLSDEDEPEVDL
ncbi:putative ribonuclease H-like domain-containing protein, partial [Tanacetum coccineum]